MSWASRALIQDPLMGLSHSEISWRARSLTVLDEEGDLEPGSETLWCYRCGGPARSEPCRGCRERGDADRYLRRRDRIEEWRRVMDMASWWPEEWVLRLNRVQANTNRREDLLWDDWYEAPW